MATGSWKRAALTAALTSLLLGGCAGMSESECRSTNWQALGELDGGVYGTRPRIDQYAHQCRAYSVEASEKEYMAGWQYGYGEYLRRMNGSECCR